MSSTIFFFFFIPLLSFILLAINLIFAPHNPYMEKNSAFECGYSSFLGQNRTQFSISFFIFALLFLLFDLEILLVYPYLVSAYLNEVYGLCILMIFLGALTVGFVFELGKKALTIDSRQTSPKSNKPMLSRESKTSNAEKTVFLKSDNVGLNTVSNTISSQLRRPTNVTFNTVQKRSFSSGNRLMGRPFMWRGMPGVNTEKTVLTTKWRVMNGILDHNADRAKEAYYKPGSSISYNDHKDTLQRIEKVRTTYSRIKDNKEIVLNNNMTIRDKILRLKNTNIRGKNLELSLNDRNNKIEVGRTGTVLPRESNPYPRDTDGFEQSDQNGKLFPMYSDENTQIESDEQQFSADNETILTGAIGGSASNLNNQATVNIQLDGTRDLNKEIVFMERTKMEINEVEFVKEKPVKFADYANLCGGRQNQQTLHTPSVEIPVVDPSTSLADPPTSLVEEPISCFLALIC